MALRAMWTGAIAFGLVSVQIKLYKATENHDMSFSQFHGADCGKISYAKTCADCGEVVPQADIVKGTKVGDTLVTVTDDEIKSLQGEMDKEITVLQFVDPAEINPVAYESSYYAVPSGSANGYALLMEAMRSTDKVAICQVTLRSKTSLAALRILDNRVLAMSVLSWPDEIRTPAFDVLDKPVSVKDNELAVAKMLVESMSGTFKPENFSDDYQDRLKELIAAKADGTPFVPVQAQPVTEDVTDLMAMLEASIAAKNGGHTTAKKRAPRKTKVVA